MHLSRLGAEIVLWSSEEFGFLELGDSFTSGSSIMPQKKNPDAAELLRAKAPRVAAAPVDALLGVMHALPLAYNKDMQEDKEHLFDTVDTLNLCLEAATGMLRTAPFDRERLAAAAARRVPGRDRHRRPARAPRRAVPRVARGRRRPRAPRARGRQAPVRAHPRGAGRVLRPPRRRVLHGAVQRLLAGVEGVGGRHRFRPAVASSSSAPARCWREWSRDAHGQARCPHGLARLRQVREGRPRVRARADRVRRARRRAAHLRARRRARASRSSHRAPSGRSSPTSRRR